MHPSSNIPYQFLLECFHDPSSSSTSIEWTWVLETLTSTNGELHASLLKDLLEAVPDLFHKSSECAKDRLGLKMLEDWISAKNPCPPLPSSVPDFLFVNSDYECGVDIDRSSLDVLLTLLRKAKMTSRDDQIDGGVERLRHYIHQFINKKRKTLPNSIADLESVCQDARELMLYSTDKISVLGIKQIPVAQKCLYTIDGNVESQADASDSVTNENGNVLLEYNAMRTEQQAAHNCKENELLKQIATTFIADTGILISQGPSGNDKISPLEVLSGTVIGEQIFEEIPSITDSKNDELREGITLTVNNTDVLYNGTIVGENSKEIMEPGHLSTENATLTASEDDSLHECSPYTENDEDDWEGDSDSEIDYLISHEDSLTPKFNFLKRITSSIRGLFGIPSRASIASANENNNEMSPGIEEGIDAMQKDPLVRNSSDGNLQVGPQMVECENENENLPECHPVIVGSKLLQPPPVDTEDDNKSVQDSFFTAIDGDTQSCNQSLQDSPPVTHKTNESQGRFVIEMDIKSMEEVPSTYPECSKQHVNNDDNSREHHSKPVNQSENISPRIFVQHNEELMNENHDSIHVFPEQGRESGDWRTVDLCFKCHKDGSLLLCRDANCCVVFHKKCVSLLDRDKQGRSYCPLCLYKQALTVYHTTKVRYSQAKKSFKHFLGKDATNHMKRKRRQAKDVNMSDSDRTRKCVRTAVIKKEVKEENVVQG